MVAMREVSPGVLPDEEFYVNMGRARRAAVVHGHVLLGGYPDFPRVYPFDSMFTAGPGSQKGAYKGFLSKFPHINH
jgi:hypothetical protein